MDKKNKRRSFLKYLLSLMAFSAGSALGLRIGKSGRIKMGIPKARAETLALRRVKKIACEEGLRVGDMPGTKRSGDVSDLELQFRDMDEAGIDMQVVSHLAFADDLRKQNDALAEVVNKYPERFAAFCALPLEDPDAASTELERAVKDLGMVGAMIYVDQGGSYKDDRKYWGVYETAVKLDVPIYMHPGNMFPDMSEPYTSPYPVISGAMWGYAAIGSLHAVRLIVSGVFDKYPGLKIILGHGGEGIPYWLWRMDNMYEKYKTRLDKDAPGQNLKHKPSYYFLNNFYITTSGMCWHPVLQFQIAALGADRILFATDYAQESHVVAAQFIESAPISAEDKEKICHLNEEKLFRL